MYGTIVIYTTVKVITVVFTMIEVVTVLYDGTAMDGTMPERHVGEMVILFESDVATVRSLFRHLFIMCTSLVYIRMLQKFLVLEHGLAVLLNAIVVHIINRSFPILYILIFC